MKLSTVNKFLTKLGLVLVIMYSQDDPEFDIRFWIEKFSTFIERNKAVEKLIEQHTDTFF